MIICGWSAGSFLAGAACIILPDVSSAQAVPYPVDTIPAFRPANVLLGPDLNGADAEGRVAGVEGYGYTHVQVPGGRATADSLRAYLVGGALSDGSLTIDTLGHLAGGGRFGVEIRRNPPYVSIIPNPLAIEDQVLLLPDGWIAFAFTDPYRVEWRRPDGTISTGRPLQRSRIRVTEEALCAIRRRKGSESCEHIEVPDVPKFLPPFLDAALLPAPDGSLLVRRAPSDDNAPNYYDVVDRSGIVRHVLRLAGNQWIVGSGPESLYVVTEDQVGLQWLTRHHWPYGRGGR